MSPLKLICKACGELMLMTNSLEPMWKLTSKIHRECPNCGRTIKPEDVDDFKLEIKGTPATKRFYERYNRDKHSRRLYVGNEEPESFKPALVLPFDYVWITPKKKRAEKT